MDTKHIPGIYMYNMIYIYFLVLKVIDTDQGDYTKCSVKIVRPVVKYDQPDQVSLTGKK